jgi:hypothetical protein
MQAFADECVIFFQLYYFFHPKAFICDVSLMQGVMLVPEIHPTAFGQNVLADRMYIRAKSCWIIDGPFLHRQPHSAKRFLAYVFNRLGVYAASAKRDPQALTEVRNEMSFCFGIVRP